MRLSPPRLRFSAVVAAVIYLVNGSISATDEASISATQISPRVWYFQGQAGMADRANQGFMSNAGFVVTDAGVVVFDALATPALGSAMLREIRRISHQPVKYVIASHYHADHIYGLQIFKQLGAEIWARAEGAAYLRSDAAQERLQQRRQALSPWVDNRTRLVAADRWLELSDQQTLKFQLGGIDFELISGGDSHSPGDLMLSIPSEGVIFAGDLFFTGRLPFVVDGNTRSWLNALDQVAALNAKIVVPGHGAASHEVEQDLGYTIRYLAFLRKIMGEAVDDLQSFDEAYKQADWSPFEAMPTFKQSNRRNAYSVFLEMQAEMLGDLQEETR